MKKGLSPLVATVLLVSITIVVAAVVASWANFFIRGKTQDIQKASDADKVCQFANMRLMEEVKSYSGNTISIGIDNNGKVPLSNFSFIVKYKDENAPDVFSLNAPTLDPTTFTILSKSGVTKAPSQVIVRTSCSDVFLTVDF